MGIKDKVVGAWTYWTNPLARRTGVLASCQTYAGSLVILGIVFIALVASGTFPAPLSVLQRGGLLGLYLAKYCLYILSGALAWLAVLLAHRALAREQSTGVSQGMLLVVILSLFASVGLTIATLVTSATHSHGHTPWFVYLIDVVVIVVRLLFASTVILALWTLREAAQDPAIARLVLTGIQEHDAYKLPVSSNPAAGPASAIPGYATAHPHPHQGTTPAHHATGAVAAGMPGSTGLGCTHAAEPFTMGPPAAPSSAGAGGSFWGSKMARKAARQEAREQRHAARHQRH